MDRSDKQMIAEQFRARLAVRSKPFIRLWVLVCLVSFFGLTRRLHFALGQESRQPEPSSAQDMLEVPYDHHAHIFSPSVEALLEKQLGLKRMPPLDGPQLLEAMDRDHVRRAVVLSTAYMFSAAGHNSPDAIAQVQSENDDVGAFAAVHRDRIVAFFSVNPLADEAIPEIERCARSGLFAGIKLHLANSKVDLRDTVEIAQLGKVFSKVDQLRLPVVIHLRTDREHYGANDAQTFIDKVLSRAPHVAIQIAHTAGWGGYDPATDAALGAFEQAIRNGPLRGRPIYFDMSAVVRGVSPSAATDGHATWWPAERYARLKQRMHSIGLGHFVFGTDWPDWTAEAYAEDLSKQLSLTHDEFNALLRNCTPWMAEGEAGAKSTKRSGGSHKRSA